MPLGGAVVAGISGIASNLIGGAAQGKATDAASAARQEALKQWLSINVPDPAQQQLELRNYAISGKLSPALESAFQQSQTGLKNLQVAPDGREAEVQALTQMQDIAKSGGLDAQAEQQLQEATNKTNANEAGQRGAIVQNFAQRGVGGAGAQLAAELEASQGDANQSAASGQAAAAAAQQRALSAMASSGSMGSNLNNQDYNQAATAATAQDAINRFNTQNSQSVQNANVTAENEAQAKNLANQQSVDNANVGISNQQQIANKALVQQQFTNQESKATGAANAENGVATQDNYTGGLANQQWSNIGNAVAQGAAAIGQSGKSSTDSESDDEESDT